MRILLAALLLIGCGKKEEQDPALDYIIKDVTGDVAKAKAAIAAGKPDDGQFKCAGALAGLAQLKTAKPELAKELDDTCNHDIHLAFLTRATEKAEAARKAQPDAKVVSECFSADHDLAVESLRKAKREDDAAKALEARFDAACPKTK